MLIVLPPYPKVFLPFPMGCVHVIGSVLQQQVPDIDIQSYNYCKYYTMQALKRPERFPNFFLELERDSKAQLISTTTNLEWFLAALGKCFSYKRSVSFEDFWYFIRKRPDLADINQ